MKKKLTILLENLTGFQVYGSLGRNISGITDDSRNVEKGDLFVAISGLNIDAHKFIPVAIASGAQAIVGEKEPRREWLNDIAYIKVPNSRKALSLFASAWYAHPSKKLKIVGVTGTDGKTTTSHLIYWILKKSGEKAGLISTISAKIGDRQYDTGFHVTNPEPLQLQKFLAKMVEKKCKYAVLEVTSHGLDQERVTGVDFDVAVLTNITHEHLDYHKTWLDYLNAKAKLFKKVKTAVLNKDDIVVYEDIKCVVPTSALVVSYGIEEEGVDYYGENIKTKKQGTEFDIVFANRRYSIKTKLFGDYNVSNILAASAVAREFKIPWIKIQSATLLFKSPVGRLEEIKNNRGFKIYVDFAHTPNSLEKVLNMLSGQTKEKLIAVFGCAGERDVAKREQMGEISGRLADVSVFTAEDPRSEDVNGIISEMAKGAKKSGAKEAKSGQRSFVRVPERGDAISYAIQKLARKGDIIVVCGKGHEKSMAYDGIEYSWNDQAAVKIALDGGTKRIKRE
ncbi:MAG: UDP-N-acetylmuramoyl-L-alanyl-D-glutamate--2,6-diaminopimelate ligase [Patescibacteria group bacterium]